jgi:type II secretory pathway component PulF
MWNPCFRDRLHTTAARLEQEGGSLVDTLVEERAIAPGSTVCAILRTGEETGRVPDMAARAGTNMWEEVNQTFQQLAVLAAWAVYIAIIVYLAIQIVTAWSGLLSRTMQLTEF